MCIIIYGVCISTDIIFYPGGSSQSKRSTRAKLDESWNENCQFKTMADTADVPTNYNQGQMSDAMEHTSHHRPVPEQRMKSQVSGNNGRHNVVRKLSPDNNSRKRRESPTVLGDETQKVKFFSTIRNRLPRKPLAQDILDIKEENVKGSTSAFSPSENETFLRCKRRSYHGVGSPSFHPGSPTNITAQLGASAYLPCRIRNLGNKSVSRVHKCLYFQNKSYVILIWITFFGGNDLNIYFNTWNITLKLKLLSNII